jgi:hypothetical protein
MKILWRKFGFTTNSSGSYEWLPGQASSSSSTLSVTGLASTSGGSVASTVTATSLPVMTPASGTALSSRVDLFIFIAAISTAVISFFLLIKEFIQSHKTKKNAINQKGKK